MAPISFKQTGQSANVLSTSGLYYKHMTIVNEDSSIAIKWSFKLIDASRGVIYYRHMFIVNATALARTKNNESALFEEWVKSSKSKFKKFNFKAGVLTNFLTLKFWR